MSACMHDVVRVLSVSWLRSLACGARCLAIETYRSTTAYSSTKLRPAMYEPRQVIRHGESADDDKLMLLLLLHLFFFGTHWGFFSVLFPVFFFPFPPPFPHPRFFCSPFIFAMICFFFCFFFLRIPSNNDSWISFLPVTKIEDTASSSSSSSADPWCRMCLFWPSPLRRSLSFSPSFSSSSSSNRCE